MGPEFLNSVGAFVVIVLLFFCFVGFFFQHRNVAKCIIKKLQFIILRQLPNRNVLRFFSTLQ